jgi:hypothetical protein
MIISRTKANNSFWTVKCDDNFKNYHRIYFQILFKVGIAFTFTLFLIKNIHLAHLTL